MHFINSFNDTHLLIDGYTLASINYIGVNQEIARTVEKEILKEVNRTVPIADIGCIASFPAINVPWNAWLIYGLLKKWSNKIDVGVSSSHFKKAFPLLSPSGMMAESFSKFPTFPHSGKMGKVDDLDTIDDLIEDYLAEYLDNDNEDSTVL